MRRKALHADGRYPECDLFVHVSQRVPQTWNTSVSIEIPRLNSFFISGSFADINDMQVIQSALGGIGYRAHMKLNDAGPTSAELISSSDVFVTVVGLEEGAIKTPDGDTLPQLELTTAIRERRPVVAFLKQPKVISRSDRQQFFRRMVEGRLGPAVIRYDSPSELPSLCRELVRFGVEGVAKPLKPLKVFVCHSSVDKPMVERIVQRLNQARVQTFYDNDSIGVGMHLKATIRKAISSVGYVLVCLSPAAIVSSWVREEIAWALEDASKLGLVNDDDDFILPVRIAPFESTPELAFLEEKHYANIAADFETGITEILAAVRR